jgi:hypothetical protein
MSRCGQAALLLIAKRRPRIATTPSSGSLVFCGVRFMAKVATVLTLDNRRPDADRPS